jgi:hypothetical protein
VGDVSRSCLPGHLAAVRAPRGRERQGGGRRADLLLLPQRVRAQPAGRQVLFPGSHSAVQYLCTQYTAPYDNLYTEPSTVHYLIYRIGTALQSTL